MRRAKRRRQISGVSVEKWSKVSYKNGRYRDRYEVSDTGSVRRVARVTTYAHGVTRRLQEKILAPGIGNCGYPIVRLFDGKRATSFHVHRLVATEFCTHGGGELVVNHIDGCRRNNRADNLEWCTHGHNMRHARARGSFSTDRVAETKLHIHMSRNQKAMLVARAAGEGSTMSNFIHRLLDEHINGWSEQSIRYIQEIEAGD